MFNGTGDRRCFNLLGRNRLKTNSELQDDVQYELIWDPGITTGEIGVTANNGVFPLKWRRSMEIPLNAQVECTDGIDGRSEYVLIDPISDQVTHLVVREDSSPNTEYIVPVDFVNRNDSRNDSPLLQQG